MNLYPIVAPPTGRHEVIIDAPEHRLSSVDMTLENWQDLLATYGARYHALGADWPHVSLYRNAGRKAGASIEHPHSQIIAMARQPAAVKSVHARLQRAFRESGRCLLCDQLRRAAEDGGRLVAESSDFAVLAPEVPEVSFEVWVVPRAHGSVFARNDAEIAALARSLHDLLYRMNRVLGDFDYNMMLQCDGPGDHPHLHWFMRLRPKLETGGGFEMATGISVNATQPESDATALRAAGRSQP
jgi:UDPglucose--hexose-1-phosphate uridylyltransferase